MTTPLTEQQLTDTLPVWLHRRFAGGVPAWEYLDDTDRAYWEHEADAVRRATARRGFKTPAATPSDATQALINYAAGHRTVTADSLTPYIDALIAEVRAEAQHLVQQMCDALNGHDCPPPDETPMGAVTRFAVRLMEAERQLEDQADADTVAARATQVITTMGADIRELTAQRDQARARTLTEGEYNSAWHAVEGAAGEEGADPGTILHAVLGRLGIATPAP